MNSPEACRYLPWDSEFFGQRIARVIKHRISRQEMDNIIAWCDQHAIKCLYFLADSDHPETIQLVEHHSFRFFDIRVTFQQDISRWEEEPNQLESGFIRRSRSKDIPALQYIARVGFTNSRFYNDPCFSLADSARLYETWIKNSCDGLADIVYVAEAEGRTIGFITCQVLTEKSEGNIGLIGIEEQSRGLGAGKALVNQALSWFANQGIRSAIVVTQGSNLPAQRLYQRCGFLTKNVQVWYHKWFSDCSSILTP